VTSLKAEPKSRFQRSLHCQTIASFRTAMAEDLGFCKKETNEG